MVRDHADEGALRVLVVELLGARPRVGRRFGGRRGTKAVGPEPEPAEVTTTRATVIRGNAVDEAQARAWIAAGGERAAEELVVLNRVVHLHRVAAADATARDVRLPQAIAVRVGFGAGEEVAYGRWTEAIEVDPEQERGPRRSRRGQRAAVLRPQERLAALLGGRDVALAAEELTLRVRDDLDGDRAREAALGLRVALEAALAELEPWTGRPELAERVAALRDDRGTVGAAANAALRGGLDPQARASVERALARLEAALRARVAYAGQDPAAPAPR